MPTPFGVVPGQQICCPSRSELVSGRYYHNILTHQKPACMHINESKVNDNTFARYLNESAGYRVGM
jgi:arylsulfatase A-like enzyme